MKLVKNIFTVSFFAIMVVVGARAEIVSKTNIVAGDNVTISTPAAGEPNGGKIVIKATNTTYTQGTSTYSGTTKLYNSIGDETDGTVTNAAIKTALSEKQPTLTTANLKGSGSVGVDIENGVVTISGTDTKYTLPNATEDTKGGVRIVKSAGESEIPSDGAKVPTLATAAEMANEIANSAINENAVIKQQGTSRGDRILTTNPAGEVKPVDVTDNETGYVVTGVDVKEGEFILNRGNVQVPVGSATATTYAPIWIE